MYDLREAVQRAPPPEGAHPDPHGEKPETICHVSVPWMWKDVPAAGNHAATLQGDAYRWTATYIVNEASVNISGSRGVPEGPHPFLE